MDEEIANNMNKAQIQAYCEWCRNNSYGDCNKCALNGKELEDNKK